ncbi:MAG: EamA family transporter [Firmicutes bacterium]|nr:EamA family transporter [Bacillota bacterium]
MDDNRRRALAALLGAVLIWSSTYVSTKQAISQVPPGTLAFLRFLLANLVLLPFYYRDPQRGQGVGWKGLAWMGFTGAFLYFALQNWGLYFTSVSAGSLIQGGIPAIIALCSVIFLRERVSAIRAVGIFLSIAGVVGIIMVSGDITGGSRPFLGNMMMLGSCLAWAAYTMLNKRLNLSVNPVTATLGTFFFGMLFMLPLMAYELKDYHLALSWLTVGNILYLGVVASALPIFLWNYALLHTDASEAGLYINLVPVVSVISAVIFLKETVNLGQIVSGAVVILGVLVASGIKTGGRSDRLEKDTRAGD